MAAPYNNLRSKTNRAIAAYLVSVGAGGPDDVLPANSRKPVSYPYTLVQAVSSKPECQLGPRRITVHVTLKGSAVQDPNEPNPDQARLDFDERVATTFDALMQSDDDQTLRYTARAITAAAQSLAVPVDNTPSAVQFAANNADMADFNCQAWYEVLEGDGEPDKEGTSWTQVLVFEALCQADSAA